MIRTERGFPAQKNQMVVEVGKSAIYQVNLQPFGSAEFGLFHRLARRHDAAAKVTSKLLNREDFGLSQAN